MRQCPSLVCVVMAMGIGRSCWRWILSDNS